MNENFVKSIYKTLVEDGKDICMRIQKYQRRQ